jgi:GNAT superfamily N-acetyltransferase
MKSVHLKRQELTGETEIAVQRMLKKAFPDVVGDCYSAAMPERIVLLLDKDQPIGHIAAYVRQALVGEETLNIGLIGGVFIEPNFRCQGHAKRLLQEAHEIFVEAFLPFSVLVAYEPERYRSSGYHTMTNEMRFMENGQWRQFVHRGGMVAELGERKWPDKLLNLRGPLV